MKITKEKVEENYIKRSKISKDFFNEHFITIPCTCDYEKCQGWQVTSNDPFSIKMCIEDNANNATE